MIFVYSKDNNHAQQVMPVPFYRMYVRDYNLPLIK